ncbi:MAG: histidinol-phosphatase [Kiritimatiellae bacterium]|nr:histidinol-phosphatase [Kiritimatiellia bacterium]
MTWASYHNHTTFSDGAHSPSAYLPFAEVTGVTRLGFADHYYKAAPDATTTPDWAIQPEALESYFNTISALVNTHPTIEITTGLEFDWLDESAKWLAPIATDKRLDYTIGSVHFVGTESIDLTRSFWEALTLDEVNEVIRRYWQTVRDMASSRLFDIVGHLDLYKKFGFYPTESMQDVISDALDAISDAKMVVELNTAGWRKPCKVCYPDETLLRECFRRNLPVTISSDAHQANLVAADFDRAADLLARIGYQQLTTFRQREPLRVPLAQ